MKTKPFIFAIGLCLLLLSGCVASVGPEYGYYSPPPRYYAPVRPYYAPRPVVVVPGPYYRQPYRPRYQGNRHEGGYYRDNNSHGNSHGQAGNSRHRRD